MTSTNNFDWGLSVVGDGKRGIRPIDDRIQVMKSVGMSSGPAIGHAIFQFLLWLGLILTLITIGLISSAGAETETAPVVLSQDGDFRVALSRHSQVFLDKSRSVTIDRLLDTPEEMTPVTKEYVDFGLTDARIWLHTSLINPSQKGDVWRLDLKRQFVKALDVYVIRDGRAEKVLTHTGRDRFEMRAIPNRYLAVDVPVNQQETVDIIVAYESDASTWLPYLISTKEAYAVAHARENLVNWLLNGALGAVLVIALILFPVVGWQISLAFCAYIISGSLFVFNSEGYAFQYLWPNAPSLNDPVDLIFILMMAAAGPAFGRVFFEIDKHSPLLNRALLSVVVTAFVFAVLTFPLFHSALFKQIAYSLVLISTSLHVGVALLAFRNGLPGSSPFLVGAVCVLGSMLFALLAHLRPGVISLEATLDVGHITLLIESIAFAAAIAIRMHLVRIERDQALRAELHAAQDKLRMQNALFKSQAQYDSARALAKRRRDELSSVRHDIAQPLTSLRAAMVNLEGVDEETTQKLHASFDYLESLARQGALIDQVTGDSPGSNAGIETFQVSVILDNVVALFAREAAVKGLEFRRRAVVANVETDPLELMRIVSNLVSNAVKNTENGGVLISAHRRAGKIEIGVRDTGPGMTAEALSSMRKKGEKGAASEGQGLGLHLVEEAARRLGIEFDIQSYPQRGTVVRLALTETP